MKAWNRLTFLCAVTIVCLIFGTFFLLYISLIPHFKELGWEALAFLTLVLICIGVLVVVCTYSVSGILLAKHKRARLYANLIVANEVVAFRTVEGIAHLSAEHERAKVVAALPAPRQESDPDDEEEEPADDLTVLSLWEKGNSLRKIAAQTNRSYSDVQKITSEWKEKHFAQKSK